MAREETAVRIGPASLFSLVVVVCLAVMAVLSVATAQAASAEADAQAAFATDSYANDADAAEELARIDAALAAAQAEGVAPDDAVARACGAVTVPASADGRTITLEFEAQSGRTLAVGLDINDDMTYDIVQWTTGVKRAETSESAGLWTGR